MGGPLTHPPLERRLASLLGRQHGVVSNSTRLPAEDIARKDGIPITRPPRTLLDLAETVDRRRLERTIDEAQRLGLCEERQLRAAVERNPGRIGGGRLAVLLDEHAAGSTATANDFEELFLALCRERHLPPPEVNAWVGPYKPDFLWRSQRVIVETDGRAGRMARGVRSRATARGTSS